MGWTPPPQAAPYSNPEEWKAPPQGFFYNVGPNVAWYHAYMQQWELAEKKKAEKNKIKEIGKLCGLPALLFVVVSLLLNTGLSLIIELIPSLGSTTALLGFDIIVSLLSLGLPFVLSFFLMKKKQIIPKLPYQKPVDTKTTVFLTMASIPTMIFSSLIINFISLIVQTMLGIEFGGGMEGDTKYSTLGMVFLFISVAIVPAVIEEFAVRGVVMQPLLKYGEKFAILTSALFFSLLHGNMFQIPYTFVGGLILGYLLIRTKSIWPPMILHFVNNGYSALVVIFGNIFDETWGNISVYIMWLIFLIIGIIGYTGYYLNRPKEKLSEGESVLKTGEKLGAFIGNWQMITMIVVFAFLTLLTISV
jgi:membrane protease YdiL (CAAX protease family)